MTTLDAASEEHLTAVRRESYWAIAWRGLRRHPSGMIGLVGFVALAVLILNGKQEEQVTL